MRIIIKFLLFILLAFSAKLSMATHLLDGNFAVCQLGSNSFEVKMTIYRDCSAGSVALADPSSISVYDAATDTLFTAFTMVGKKVSQAVLPVGNACFTPSVICIEEHVFIDTILLPNNTAGYYLVWGSCCRNATIGNLNNPLTDGMTVYTQIPNPALANGNCTPQFAGYPSQGYVCVGYDNLISLQVTEADGDSLVYSLETPFSNASGAKPFPVCTWASGYSLTNIIGNGVYSPMSIDPVTGLITCHPESMGVYSLAVRIKEFRNGVFLGELVRDIQLVALNGCSPTPPYAEAQMYNASCFGESDGKIVVTASGGTETNYSVSVDGGITYQPLLNNPDTLFVPAGSYNVVVLDSNNCSTDTIPVIISEPAKVQFGVNVIPDTCSQGVGIIQVTNITGGNGSIYVYSIDLGATAQVSPIFQVATGGYTVIGSDIQGCYDFTFVSVPDITGSLNFAGALGPYVTCPGVPVYIEAVGGQRYFWSNSDVQDTVENGIYVTLDTSQLFYVDIISGGCTMTDSTFVTVSAKGCDIGRINNNVFSPDGDGVNEFFVLDIEKLLIHDNKVIIYNKWGDVIREFVNYNNIDVIWDGKNENGVDVGYGVYFYVVEIPEINYSNSGWVQLIR